MDMAHADKLVEGVGARIRTLREALSWTQEQLAEHVDMSAQAIARIERGEATPSLQTVLRLCVGLGVEPGELIGWDGGVDLEHGQHMQRLIAAAQDLDAEVVRRIADLAEAVRPR